MKFDFSSATPNNYQQGMHTTVSPDRGDGSRMSYLRFEDQSDGIHVFFDDVTDPGLLGTVANFNEYDIATMSRTAPHTVMLTLDTLNGPANDVVKVWIDGNLVKTGTSWEDYYRYDPESVAEQSPRIVKTVLFRESGTANPADQGKGFLFDNLSLTSGPIINVPTNKDQCKHGGYVNYTDDQGNAFANQGQCVAFVSSGGKNRVVTKNINKVRVTNNNNLSVTNSNSQNAVSGAAVVSGNTNGGSATSGRAVNTNTTTTILTVINRSPQVSTNNTTVSIQ
jgi:hypothetical protein